jgi:hypothetical protein
MRRLAQLDSVLPVVPAQQFLHARLVVFPFQNAQAVFVIRDNQHWAGGRVDVFDREDLHGHGGRSNI